MSPARQPPRSVPETLEDAVWTGPIHQVAPGRVLLDLPGVARALIDAAGSASVDPAPGAAAADVRWFTERPVREARELLGGRFALRGAGVVIDRSAIALVGHTASGKSLTAATLAQRGHRVLGDGLLPISSSSPPLAAPSAGALDLWPAGAGLLGLDPGGGSVVRAGLAKRAFGFAAATRHPLGRIVVLERVTHADALAPAALRGLEAIACLQEATAARVLLDPLGLRGAHFAWMWQLAHAAEVIHLRIDVDRHTPQAVADTIESWR